MVEFAADEARLEQAAKPFGGRRKLVQQARKQFKALPVAEFPTLVALTDQLLENDSDAVFEFGLDTWLAGLEHMLARERSR